MSEREAKAHALICIMAGALSVLAPENNEPLKGVLKEATDWINEGIEPTAQDSRDG